MRRVDEDYTPNMLLSFLVESWGAGVTSDFQVDHDGDDDDDDEFRVIREECRSRLESGAQLVRLTPIDDELFLATTHSLTVSPGFAHCSVSLE